MNQLRVNDIADAKARKMIAKYPECRIQAICSFILHNALHAQELRRMLELTYYGGTRTPESDEFITVTEQKILDDFRRTLGHEMIAPPEPDHDSTN